MTEAISQRVDRLDVVVGGLATNMAKVEACVVSIAEDVKASSAKIDKIETSRPGVNSILPWLTAGVAVITLIGGALVVPQLSRIDRIETANSARVPVAREQTADIAILCHDALRRGDLGCAH